MTEFTKKTQTQLKQAKTFLYIDGTNLFAGQYELCGPKHYLSYRYLRQIVHRYIPIDHAYFYASYMQKKKRPSRKTKQLFSAEALFYREVKRSRNVTFYKGHRSSASGKEKGVDVHLSVDIVKDVFLGKCGTVILMSGDADMIYPLEIAKRMNIPTYAFFLPNRFCLEMTYKVDGAYVLNWENTFAARQKIPRQLKIVEIKKPRMINIRGR